MKSARIRSARLRFLLGAGLLLAAFVVGVFVWFFRPAAPTPAIPVVDLTGADPEVAEAYTVSRAALVRAPHSGAAWGHFGMFLLVYDFHTEGRRCLAEAERLDGREQRWPYLQAFSLQLYDKEAGLPKLQRAVELDRGTYDIARLRLAETLLTLGRTDEAETQFQELLRRFPEHPRARLGLARVAYAQGRLPESKELVTPCVENRFCVKEAHALLAQIDAALGDKEAADREQRLTDDLPTPSPWPDPYVAETTQLLVGLEATYQSLNKLLEAGRLPETIEAARTVIREHPRAYTAWMILGKAYLQQNEVGAAEQAFRGALAARPGSVDAAFALGTACYQQKKIADAEAAFRTVTQLKPTSALAFFNLAECRRELGDPAGAIDAYRQALRCKPNLAEAHHHLGDLLAEQGQVKEAIEHLRYAVQLNPENDRAQARLAELVKQRE
jgi:tetratricopeptide (TPR) repeat protein